MKGRNHKVVGLFFAIVTAFTFLSNFEIVSASNKIPSDAKKWNGHYYYVYEDAESWEDAKERCKNKGGHLATITSEEEDEVIYQCLENSGHTDGYFGFYRDDSGNESVWKWVTGEKVSYTNWKPGEPNADYGGSEAYGGYWGGDQWNDFVSSELEVYICEWDGYTIHLNEKILTINPGTSEYLEYSITNTNGQSINKRASWKSSNTRVAKVSSKGKVVAVNPGTCILISRKIIHKQW